MDIQTKYVQAQIKKLRQKLHTPTLIRQTRDRAKIGSTTLTTTYTYSKLS